MLLVAVGLAEGRLVLIDGDEVGASVTAIVGLAEELSVDGDEVGASVAVGSDETGDALAVVTLMDVEGGTTGIIDGNIVGDMSANELTSMGEATKARVKLTHRFRPSS